IRTPRRRASIPSSSRAGMARTVGRGRGVYPAAAVGAEPAYPGAMKKVPKSAPRLGPRPCPVCGAKMELVAQGKIEIDVCAQHGVWLDKGELEALVESRARFERMKGRQAARRALA